MTELQKRAAIKELQMQIDKRIYFCRLISDKSIRRPENRKHKKK
ncbi:MAG: hypothetical protein ACT4OJ_14245 [Bacteroidota bacterium]